MTCPGPHCHQHAVPLFAGTKSKEIDFTRHCLPPPSKIPQPPAPPPFGPHPRRRCPPTDISFDGQTNSNRKISRQIWKPSRVREWKTSARVISGARLSTLYCLDGWWALFERRLSPSNHPVLRTYFARWRPFCGAIVDHARSRGRTVNRPPYVTLFRLFYLKRELDRCDPYVPRLIDL